MLKTTIIFDNTEFEKKIRFFFQKIIIMAYFLIYFDCRMYSARNLEMAIRFSL